LFWIEGYPGFPAGIAEAELAERAAAQAGTLQPGTCRWPGEPLSAGEPQRGGSRQFGRTSDVVFFPARG
jgi:hypothetical protein